MKKERFYFDYLLDIYEQTALIKKFIKGLKYTDFKNDIKIFYAVCRALEIIGEVVK